ncbi:MAG TPA: ribosome recycling factor [Parvibaculum sp.]|uniref:ribosome recycling factor n=1 Tax=Parvibaculum sp. TaxID=2024848 RepID=UPI002CD48B66|nr:ribosome recycling factor [Parvibaculum sp.]HMM14162.1 ribosome recycling factor [Parvibaculum sp.]
MAEQKTLDIADVERRMRGALQSLKQEFSGLRTGRASAGLLDPITVEAYGQTMPLTQVGTVGVPEPRMLTIQVWDKGMVSAVDKAIRNSGLGLNPVVDGTLIRLPIPELNQERRTELAKIAAKYTEQARVAIRNVRRDAMDELKRLEKDGHMGQDDHKAGTDKVQKLTDKIIAEVDAALAHKEAEIMQV